MTFGRGPLSPIRVDRACPRANGSQRRDHNCCLSQHAIAKERIGLRWCASTAIDRRFNPRLAKKNSSASRSATSKFSSRIVPPPCTVRSITASSPVGGDHRVLETGDAGDLGEIDPGRPLGEVLDRIIAVTCAEHERVGTGATPHRVIADATVERVVLLVDQVRRGLAA